MDFRAIVDWRLLAGRAVFGFVFPVPESVWLFGVCLLSS